MGADEQMAGYVRHRKAFGAQFPFLDSNVTDLLRRLPLDLICDFFLPPGQGDKRILRLVAMQLGLDIGIIDKT
jgi:hypothetical protein